MESLNNIQIIHAADADQHLGHLKKILDELKSERRINSYNTLESDAVNQNSLLSLGDGDMVITLLTDGISPLKAFIEETMLKAKTSLPETKMAEIIIDHVPYENQFIAFPSDLQPIRSREDMDGAWTKIGQTLREIFPIQEAPVAPVAPVPWKKYLPYALGALALIVLFLLIPAPDDDEMSVVSVGTSVASLETDTDDCPKQFDFQGTIKVNAPGTVIYTWVRSDGQPSAVDTLQFDAAGEKQVSSSWILGSDKKKYEEWQQLKIMSPKEMLSDQETISFECKGAGPGPTGPIGPVPAMSEITVTSKVIGDEKIQIRCGESHRYSFSGIIKANGKGSVDYVWVGNDGSKSSVQTLVFQKAESKVVSTTKTLVANSQSGYEGWLALEVVSPKRTSSNKTAFLLTCKNNTPPSGGIQTIRSQIRLIGSSNSTTNCPKQQKFVAQIKTDGPGAVRYTWVRKNGTTSPVQTINFEAADVKNINYTLNVTSSTTNDWVQLKIISPKPLVSNKATFTLKCTQNSSSAVIRHVAKASNTAGHITTINHSATNGKSDVILLVTQKYGVYNVNEIGVWYNAGKWKIFNENRKPMPKNAIFNVMVVPKNSGRAFVHTTTTSNTSGHITTLNSALTNGKPNALVYVTHNYGKYDTSPVGVWYNGGKWKIYNEITATKMPVGTKFNVLVLNPGETRIGNLKVYGFKYSNISTGHISTMRTPRSFRTSANLFITQNYRNTYNPNVSGVWLSGTKWTAFNQNRKTLPKNVQFNVMVTNY